MSEGIRPNQAIQLTYPGMAALAVVRVQGPAAAGLVARHFDRKTSPGRCVYGRWSEENGQVLDDVVVVQGDGWFDVNLHGGRRIVARVLEQADHAGFEMITGERAIEAAAEDEIESALPLATTGLALRWLLGQPAAWRALDPERADIESLLNDMTLRRLIFPATVAIVGAPNVGKSTLANALFGQERAIVADVPGTTRDWVGGLADLGRVPVVLVDTPGRRESADPIEREAIALSEMPVARADLVVSLIDATQAASGTASPEPSRRGEEKPWSGPLSATGSAASQTQPRRGAESGRGGAERAQVGAESGRGGAERAQVGAEAGRSGAETPASRGDAVEGAGCAMTQPSRGDAAERSVPTVQVANKCDLAEAPAGWLAISAKTGAGLPALIEEIHRGLGVDVSNAHREIRANFWNLAQEKLLREGGARAVSQIAHRLGNW